MEASKPRSHEAAKRRALMQKWWRKQRSRRATERAACAPASPPNLQDRHLPSHASSRQRPCDLELFFHRKCRWGNNGTQRPQGPSRALPLSIQKLMEKTNHTWPTPGPHSLFQSCGATHWLFTFWDWAPVLVFVVFDHRQEGTDPSACSTSPSCGNVPGPMPPARV